MKELTKTRRLIIASVIFILILIVGFITFKTPEYVYTVSPEEALQITTSPEYVISPDEFKALSGTRSSEIVLVDLRSPYEYNKGSLDAAINIPVSDILDRDINDMFKGWQQESKTVVLFAASQQAANAPWMVLSQLGFANMKVLEGGYAYLNDHDSNQGAVASKQAWKAEEPALDYAKFIEDVAGGEVVAPQTEPNQIITVRRNKKSVTAGGC